MELYHEFSVYGGYTTTLYLKRNMAGGEKKRVSEIERERASRAVAEQQAKASSQGDDSTSSSGQGMSLTKCLDQR